MTHKASWNPQLYNEKHGFVYSFGQDLVEWLQPHPGERILDLGCGAGQLTHIIHQQGAHAVGMDKSASMIQDARAKFPDLEFHVMDAADFQFDIPFHAIFSNAALHWVLDAEGAVRAMYHNLTPGGRLVLEMGGKGNVATIIKQLRKVLHANGYENLAEKQVWFFPTIGEYTSLLERVGFHVRRAYHFDRPTELADEETGIIDWLKMFGGAFFEGISEDKRAQIQAEVQEHIKDQCLLNGKWYADYQRLRILAFRA